MPLSATARSARASAARVTAVVAVLLVLAGLLAPAGTLAANGPVMTARALLEGHVRAGNWFAVAVDLENAGPTVNGELRISGGIDSRTRFTVPVELATGSRKTVLLYAQPPTFGGTMKVQLVDGDTLLSEAKVATALHDASQLVVGVVAENPAKVVSEIKLLPGPTGMPSVVVPLKPEDLPERVQAWSGIDRLVWQDTDAASLTPGQLTALQGWVAAGGRLVIVGGTAGADSLNAFPDALLPYRPTSVLDIDPSVLRAMLGGLPANAATLTAYAGDRGAGRPLAMSGDRVIAADMAYGNGTVTLLGFDPTTGWMAQGESYDTPLWRRLLPARVTGNGVLTDDSQILSAVGNLPSLALPPLGGLLVLLLGYIVLVGPVNYLVLKRVDRREWAWVTVPVLIAVFTIGSFAFGGLLRGNEVIVHEVAIVRGAPGTDAASTTSYMGIFSPSRNSYQLRVPGDALLAAPINGDIFGNGTVNTLDIVEGDPSRVRDLAVGVGSLRTIRADASASGPDIAADLAVTDGRLEGTITNRSSETLVRPALVVGSAAQRLDDIPPGGTTKIGLTLGSNPVNQASLSDRLLDPMNWDGSRLSEDQQRNLVRRAVLDQLAVDPMTGFSTGLPADAATLVAWGTKPVIPLEVQGQQVRHLANVMYAISIPYTMRGTTTFRYDLIRASTLDAGPGFFSRDPWAINLGAGKAVISYRPIPFEGTFDPTEVRVGLTFGGDFSMPAGSPLDLKETTRCDPASPDCRTAADGLPEIEVLDRATGEWIQFQHLAQGRSYTLPDPKRWVDPATGEVQVRFVNETANQLSFQFPIAITGTIR